MILQVKDRTYYSKIAQTISFQRQAFIDGESVWSKTGDLVEIENPARTEILGTIASCGPEDVDSAVAAARRAFNEGAWSRAAPDFRKEVLLRIADSVEANAEELAVLESLDSGKTIRDCLHEIGTEVPTFFRWYAELVDKLFGKVAPTSDAALALIIREPIGVVGLVLPWNFPLLIAAWKLAPALAAGCSVVLKPAEQTSLSAMKLAVLASEAGLPDGVLNVVPGLGETVGRAIGLHSDIDAVSFTGSTEVGALFMEYASQSNLKTVGLELGGKSPFLVLDDAELNDELIDSAILAAFWNGGQNCSANMRQIVSHRVHDDYMAKVVARANALKVGDPLDPTTDIGAMVSREQRDRVLSYILLGSQEGAKPVAGGKKAPRDQGYFLEPTVFDGVTNSMRIAKEEIFGPVLGVIKVHSLEEALDVASDTQFGLHASVFTKDIDRAVYFARRLACGTISVNAFSEGNVTTPFGGYKRSGSLARDNGVEALDQYLQTKTIWLSVTKPS